jgi:hypothetical protein
MKRFMLAAGILFASFSCKVTENIAVDQISKTSSLAEMKTFQLISQKNGSWQITQLNKIFQQKLIKNGFSLAGENPDLLVQTVITSVGFESKILDFTTISGPVNTGLYNNSFTLSGEYGKVIFLIQDAKTNEILWMGTGTGILSTNDQLNKKDIKTALDQLIAELK